MAENTSIGTNVGLDPVMQYCPRDAEWAPQARKYRRDKNSPQKKLVDRVFKIFGSEKSNQITLNQIIEVDRKDGVWAEHGVQMNQQTLSGVDIQIALKNPHLRMVKNEAVKKSISQNEFIAILGGCFSQETVGNKVIITRDQALLHLKRNEAHFKKLADFTAFMY